jgi:hypothetical protein
MATPSQTGIQGVGATNRQAGLGGGGNQGCLHVGTAEKWLPVPLGPICARRASVKLSTKLHPAVITGQAKKMECQLLSVTARERADPVLRADAYLSTQTLVRNVESAQFGHSDASDAWNSLTAHGRSWLLR